MKYNFEHRESFACKEKYENKYRDARGTASV